MTSRPATRRCKHSQRRHRQTRATAEGPATDGNELRSLKNAVAALMKERAEAGSAAPVDHLAASVRALGQRVEELSATVSTMPARAGADPQMEERVDALDTQLASMRASIERRASEPDRPSDELVAMLATLRSQVEALGGLASRATTSSSIGASPTRKTRSRSSRRVRLAHDPRPVGDDEPRRKEHELAALHRHFTESSTRIESIVDDIREALSALPEPGSATLDDLAAPARAHRGADARGIGDDARTAGELAGRIDVIDQRVAAVAAEVARAKTLWPVALRSLEARLDDAVHSHRPEPSATDDAALDSPADGPADDLLAGLRHSLQAMETVAAEMARASDMLGDPDDDIPTDEPAEADAADRDSRSDDRPVTYQRALTRDAAAPRHPSLRARPLSPVGAAGWSIAPWSSSRRLQRAQPRR